MHMPLIAALALTGLIVPGPALVADTPPAAAVELVAEGFDAPIFLAIPSDGSGRRFIGDQTGKVHLLRADGGLSQRPFLNLEDRLTPLLAAFDERGLWSLAFHPGFAVNGRFFVTYSAKRRSGSPYSGETAYTWRLSEFRIAANEPGRADPGSERVLLELDWVNRKHNGGGLDFGPDGHPPGRRLR